MPDKSFFFGRDRMSCFALSLFSSGGLTFDFYRSYFLETTHSGPSFGITALKSLTTKVRFIFFKIRIQFFATQSQCPSSPETITTTTFHISP
jgi:hypothetical protein